MRESILGILQYCLDTLQYHHGKQETIRIKKLKALSDSKKLCDEDVCNLLAHFFESSGFSFWADETDNDLGWVKEIMVSLTRQDAEALPICAQIIALCNELNDCLDWAIESHELYWQQDEQTA